MDRMQQAALDVIMDLVWWPLPLKDREDDGEDEKKGAVRRPEGSE